MVVYEDDAVYIVHKPAGMSAQDDLTDGPSVLSLFPGTHCITRLDKRVSGLMILARHQEAAQTWSYYLRTAQIRKIYHCVVGQGPPAEEGELVHWIRKEGTKARVFSEEKPQARKVALRYRRVRSSERYHLLEVEIGTGRFHQIRAQLSSVGCPIVGDLKYGYKRSSPDGSLFLCCTGITCGNLSLEIPLPEIWTRYGVGQPPDALTVA